jgi:hypothetical protein
VELERLKESRSAGLIGGGKQYTLEITTQPLVMASEIAGLEPLHGYIKQENYVVRVRFPYVAPIEKQPRFIERTMSISPRSVAVQQATVNAQQANTASISRQGNLSRSNRYFLGLHDRRLGMKSHVTGTNRSGSSENRK